ncbi:MAG TPA: hypothetical protein VFJ83_05150 [Nocardioidaceae bacterium]|nr:hypothetical protein [Nocardioidaceae bacterium]
MPSTPEPGEHTLSPGKRRVPSTGLSLAVREYGGPTLTSWQGSCAST